MKTSQAHKIAQLILATTLVVALAGCYVPVQPPVAGTPVSGTPGPGMRPALPYLINFDDLSEGTYAESRYLKNGGVWFSTSEITKPSVGTQSGSQALQQLEAHGRPPEAHEEWSSPLMISFYGYQNEVSMTIGCEESLSGDFVVVLVALDDDAPVEAKTDLINCPASVSKWINLFSSEPFNRVTIGLATQTETESGSRTFYKDPIFIDSLGYDNQDLPKTESKAPLITILNPTIDPRVDVPSARVPAAYLDEGDLEVIGFIRDGVVHFGDPETTDRYDKSIYVNAITASVRDDTAIAQIVIEQYSSPDDTAPSDTVFLWPGWCWFPYDPLKECTFTADPEILGDLSYLPGLNVIRVVAFDIFDNKGEESITVIYTEK